MTATLLRAAALAAIYLLVLTSLEPGDIAMGLVLGLIVAVAVRPRVKATGRPLPPRGVAAAVVRTAGEMVIGSWRVARFCLGWRAAPGLVEIPRGDRTRIEVALWGVLTGEAPDEVVVDVDEARGVLIVHLVDAANPDAVRERHRRAHDRLRGRGAADA
jgi:multisubunit Na+/H+ antiporter MnhE subunit